MKATVLINLFFRLQERGEERRKEGETGRCQGIPQVGRRDRGIHGLVSGRIYRHREEKSGRCAHI